MRFDIREVTDENFEAHALKLFHYQYANVNVYRQYVDLLRVNADDVHGLADVPFLPIAFFRSHRVIADDLPAEIVFESSTTTGIIPSRHFVHSLALNRLSCVAGFERVYDKPSQWCFLALLPSYLERGNASLVWMVNELMALSRQPGNGFYLSGMDDLNKAVLHNEANGIRTMIIGVSYALLDWAGTWRGSPLLRSVVMETGGMKGRRREMVKSEMHGILQTTLGVTNVHSEYGMTELLSQAYSTGHGVYRCPPWMRVQAREVNDPLSTARFGQAGALNIIDLANQYSCAFVATDDLGRVSEDGSFEVLGRLDNSELRGCNLLVE